MKQNIRESERATIVADFYQKPRKSPKFFERELVSGLGGKITNCTMMDSSASIMLQLVDVLLGAVMFHFKAPRLAAVDADKMSISNRLAAAYGVQGLGAAFTRKSPNYFSVWPFKPINKIGTV